MYISFVSEREPHLLCGYIDGKGIVNCKLEKSRKESLRNSFRYYIKKKEKLS